MRLPRFRFTIRRMMIAVAIVGTMLGTMIERRTRFGQLVVTRSRDYHMHVESLADSFIRESPNFETEAAAVLYHSRMCKKYARAARYPWLPVTPDPPKPE